jgi:cyanate permease
MKTRTLIVLTAVARDRRRSASATLRRVRQHGQYTMFTLGAVLGPLLMGISFDSTGSYGPVLGGFVVATLIAAGLMTQLGPYQVWEATAEAA